MKVAVTYACDLEDIPKATSELIDNLRNQMTDLDALIEESSYQAKNNSINEALESIDEVRQTLAKIDHRLMDCSSILAGYSKTKADLYLGVDPSVQGATQEVAAMDVLAVEDNNVNSEEAENDQVS